MIFRFHLFLLLSAVGFFLFSSSAFAVPTPTCKTSINGDTFSHTQLCTYETECDANAAGADTIQGIIMPTNPVRIEEVAFYFGGLSGANPDQYCTGRTKFCSHIEKQQNLAMLVFNKKANNGSNCNCTWMNTQPQMSCFVEEALNVLNGLNGHVANYSLMAHSAGGQTAGFFLQHMSSLSMNKTLLFDPCYGNWCQIVAQQPNRGQTYVYIASDGGKTVAGSEILYASEPSNLVGIRAKEGKTMLHPQVPNACFADSVTFAENNQRCGGLAEVVYPGNYSPKESAPRDPPPPAEIRYDPQLGIDIPGLELSTREEIRQNVAKGPDGSSYLLVPFLGEYIAGVFQYAVAVASIIAIVMIMIGGLQWAISRGDSSAIGGAKKRIAGAIIGLLIAFGSYTILYVINPDLLRLRELGILYVEQQDLHKFHEVSQRDDFTFDTGKTYSKDPLTGSETPTPIEHKGYNDVPMFKQGAAPWGKQAYGALAACEGKDESPPTSATCCTTFAWGGCGATAVGMVLRYHGAPVDPRHAGFHAIQTSARECNQGTIFIDPYFDRLATTYNLDWHRSYDPDDIRKQLAAKNPVLLGIAGEYGVNDYGDVNKAGGHAIVLTGIGSVGGDPVVFVNDPGGNIDPATGKDSGTVIMSMDKFESFVKNRRYDGGIYFTKKVSTP